MNTNPQFEPSNEEVQKAAYLLYLASGCVPGHDLENWLAARERITSQHPFSDKTEQNSMPVKLHFPLNANASRAPFQATSASEYRN